MPFDQPIGPRAGYWRRFLALLIDYIIVLLPFQLIAALLFVATSGFIQLPPP
jgi:RDD family